MNYYGWFPIEKIIGLFTCCILLLLVHLSHCKWRLNQVKCIALCFSYTLHILRNHIWVFYAFSCSCFSQLNHNENLFVCFFSFSSLSCFQVISVSQARLAYLTQMAELISYSGRSYNATMLVRELCPSAMFITNNKQNLQGTDMFRLFSSLVWWQPFVFCFF